MNRSALSTEITEPGSGRDVPWKTGVIGKYVGIGDNVDEGVLDGTGVEENMEVAFVEVGSFIGGDGVEPKVVVFVIEGL